MRSRKSNTVIYVLLFFILLIAAFAYIYNAKMFEQQAPTIDLPQSIDWNLKKPITVNIADASGIKFVRAVLSDGTNSIVLNKKVYEQSLQEVKLDIVFPKTGFMSNKKNFELSIDANDASKWNFFSGNTTTKKSIITVDTKKPELFIINNSYKIIKGGSAAVVFKTKDENLKELFIQTNFGKKFYPTPFYKQNHFVSLLAWPSDEENFSADIVAIDKAGNIAKERIRFYLKNRKYKVSKIPLRDNFLEGKIADLASEYSQNPLEDKIAKFKFVNEDLRIENENHIEKITTKVPQDMISDFVLEPFYPLKNGAAVASFGDQRFYTYGQKEISKSLHVGLDFASTAKANIITNNVAEVVFAGSNGIYGDNMILSHGLGLYSLYGHCSSFFVQVGDKVAKNTPIATTGTTGLALGDHLHFGVLVQGVEVRPEEWMDSLWLNENIFTVLNNAKKMLDR
ncbi:MAG: M23 family metallopeptidase [Sulfurospirillum sp.]|nr:M23 family metallopeptidase [Sulfurospirillum sp.]